jgi:FkbM family methyltransferase
MLSGLVKNVFGSRRTPTVNLEQSGDAGVFLVGYPGAFFNIFAPGIAHAAKGRVVAVVSDQYAPDHPQIKLWGKEWPLITLPQLQAIARERPVEEVHFYDSLDQFWGLSTLAGLGNVKVTDFLAKLDELGLPHTYMAVKDEREWWTSQSPSLIQNMMTLFADQRSKRTLEARIAAIREGKRHHLMEVSFGGDYEYFNRSTPQASLIPSADEIYVDVGAAHGDTVDRFVNLVGGRFKAIHAFEPTPGQYAQLETRSKADPRISTYRTALGEAAGKITFFDNAANPFGGNALAGEGSGTPIEVDCARLDDMVDECTLLKMDVEGYECRVLRGARDVIAHNRPNMAITCYHYPQDMFEIIETVRGIHEYKNIALRHYGPSLYDSILLFSDRQSFG